MVIPFEKEYREKFYKLEEQIFESNMWSEGQMLHTFEEKFGEYVQLGARGIADGGAGLAAILSYIDVRGKDVIVPSNTFWADAQAVKYAGGNIVFADCNRDDLCLSLEDLKKKITPNTKAVIVVHIGGHIAFQIEEIVDFCKQKGIYLVEDCAHVHGAWWNGKTGGHYGFAGSYSFYATKTMPLGDGGMVVSKDAEFLRWVEEFRNYGKEVIDGNVYYRMQNGFNFRLSEFSAALGIVQMERLPKILEWKRKLAEKYNQIFENHVKFPKGMESGYYKYIVFDTKLKQWTGQVFGPRDLGHRIAGVEADVPNSEWVVLHHQCAPIYFGYENADSSVDELRKILLG
ncbi:MAG: aminotransferase class V-fold PLP-dependent enzyme [Lachnospiraceae bacterium]|jgi:dTDP-4-amino-4,6-dideoxygalactose transaminase|nr:aminotransferase class V-fold PLP-dependent enzyme [Lachnospiraceae bacterium]